MIQRDIFEVYAKVIDSNGSYNTLSGYPKVFDSRSYENNINKAYRRAEGEYHDTYGAMCKRDDRQLQTVILMRANGDVIESAHIGEIASLPDPVPETPTEGEGDGE